MLFSYLFTDPVGVLIWVAVLLMSLAFHEYAHAYVAYRLGDSTAFNAGRLTLNPIAHIDWLGLLFIVLVGFGWGKPVPINVDNLRDRRWGHLKVSIAGPISNVLLGLVVAVVARLVGPSLIPDVWSFLGSVVAINFILAIFNIIPVPPLDGSAILEAIAPARWRWFVLWFRQRGVFFLFCIVILLQFTSWDPFMPIKVLALHLAGLPT